MDELKVGCRLKIFADEGVYEGNVHAVDLKGTGKDDRVTLHKGNSVPPIHIALDYRPPFDSVCLY